MNFGSKALARSRVGTPGGSGRGLKPTITPGLSTPPLVSSDKYFIGARTAAWAPVEAPRNVPAMNNARTPIFIIIPPFPEAHEASAERTILLRRHVVKVNVKIRVDGGSLSLAFFA